MTLLKESSSVGKDYEPFDRNMKSFFAEDKNFISKGPQKINMVNHRTQCSLILNEDDGSKSQLLRASCDLYKNNTNFSDLPDLSSMSKDEMSKRIFLTKLSTLNQMARSMQYDEKLQALLYRQKNIKVFKDSLRHFNKNFNGKIGKNRLKFVLPNPWDTDDKI